MRVREPDLIQLIEWLPANLPGRLRLAPEQDAYQLSEVLGALKGALGFSAPVPGPWDDFQEFADGVGSLRMLTTGTTRFMPKLEKISLFI